MQAISPVIPNETFPEIIIAEHQPEYIPIPSIRLDGGVFLARLSLTDSERKQVAETGDIYVFLHTGGKPVFPFHIQTETPELQVQPFLLASIRKTPERVAEAAAIGVEITTGHCNHCREEVIASTASLEEKTTGGAPVEWVCLDCYKAAGGKIEDSPIVGSDEDFEKVTEHLRQNS